jgi:hypothetical protein
MRRSQRPEPPSGPIRLGEDEAYRRLLDHARSGTDPGRLVEVKADRPKISEEGA